MMPRCAFWMKADEWWWSTSLSPVSVFSSQHVKLWQTHCSTRCGLWVADPTWTASGQPVTARARRKTSFRRLFSILLLFITALVNIANDGVRVYGDSHCDNIKRIIYLEVLVFLSIFWGFFFRLTFLSLPDSFEKQLEFDRKHLHF